MTMKNKGAILFARNNSNIDYVKQAYFAAIKIQEFLNIPVTLITDSKNYLESAFPNYKKVFDQVIQPDLEHTYTLRKYFDGALTEKQLEFKNDWRSYAYDLSPYDETLLLDTDVILANDQLKNCFSSQYDILAYKKAYDLANYRDYREFEYTSDSGVDFYWATCVFFRKTEENKIFFDLIKHIQENWIHYKRVYQIMSPTFRNDFAFSIAIHIMNGMCSGDFIKAAPGTLYYITDKDILWEMKDTNFLFLVEKEKFLGEYTAIKTKNTTVHIMNKFSLNREIDKALESVEELVHE